MSRVLDVNDAPWVDPDQFDADADDPDYDDDGDDESNLGTS